MRKTPHQLIVEVAKEPRSGDGFILEAYKHLRQNGVSPANAHLALSLFISEVIHTKALKKAKAPYTQPRPDNDR